MKPKVNIKLFLFLSILCFSFYSCKDDEDNSNESDDDPLSFTEVKFGEFVLDNQYGLESLLSVNDMKIVSIDTTLDLEEFASKANFDLAFAYYDTINKNSSFEFRNCSESDMPRYFFAGPTSIDLAKEHNVEKFSNRSTTFYVIPNDFTASKFDTLKTTEGLKAVISSSTIHRNNLDKSSDSYFSDGFGWYKGTLIGFKTNEGKCGILKIQSVPFKYDRFNNGQIEIAIKFEGE